MSQINVDNIKNRLGSGAPSFPNGIDVSSGVTTFTNGLNVGTGASVFSPGTNELALGTNSAERVRVDSSGRVGVGTNSPTTVTQFQVLGTSAGNTATFGGINQGTSGRVGGIILGTDTDNSSRRLWGIRGEASAAGQMGIFYSSDNVTTPFSGTQTVSLTSGGNVKIENGNLVFSTSGTGIDFSAASGSAAGSTSALLDDYEEGTFTPTITQGFTGITYSTQFGRYRKIGRMVYVQFRITISGGNRTADSNNIRVNLPFAVDADGDNYATLEGYGTLYTYHPDAFFICFQGESFAALYRRGTNTQAALSGNDFGTTNPFDVIYGGWYYV
jgi:hypothetical protein